MLVKKDEPYGQEEHILASYRSDMLNRTGNLDLFTDPDGTKIRLKEKALELMHDMEEMILLLNPGAEEYLQALEINRERIEKKICCLPAK